MTNNKFRFIPCTQDENHILVVEEYEVDGQPLRYVAGSFRLDAFSGQIRHQLLHGKEIDCMVVACPQQQESQEVETCSKPF